MNQAFEMERLHYVSALLSAGLPMTSPEELPAEVAQTLELAGREMTNLPAVLNDLETARSKFAGLALTIDRMYVLADQAVRLSPDDQAGRDERQTEFVRLARVVAQLAGRQGYAGPELSLAGPPQAEAARQTLRHLLSAKATLARRLEDQKQLVVSAVTRTIEFLGAVAATYPETAMRY
ncbi:MAG: hypothetical protein V1742_09635, partial [Pseudomonadota bacterium]